MFPYNKNPLDTQTVQYVDTSKYIDQEYIEHIDRSTSHQEEKETIMNVVLRTLQNYCSVCPDYNSSHGSYIIVINQRLS